MKKNIKFLMVLFLTANLSITAQNRFSHEVGAFIGGVAMQSDFGVRKDFETNSKNVGFGIGIVHYLDFANDSDGNYNPYTYFNDHFKLRTELSYNSTKLEHYGEWADRNSVFGRQLKAMKGEAKVTDVGMQLEYYPLSIREFTAAGNWAPFISLGMHFSVFRHGTYSDLGRLNTPISTPNKYFGATSTDGGSTWSVVSSVGTRYKISEISDLFIEVRGQQYFSDWVDGLKPNSEIYPENKSNDWNLWLNLGYIYHIN